VSVVAFRDPAMRAATLVPSADGCEGLYVTPTLQGSRSGATMAVAWATIVHVGDDGYREHARAIAEGHEKLKREVAAMEGLRLCVDSDLAVVPICGEGSIDVYALASLMAKRGWGVFTGQKPPTLSLPVGEQTPATLDQMLADLRSCLAFLHAHPETKPEGQAAVYGAAAAIPDAVVHEILRGYVEIKMRVKPAEQPAPAGGAPRGAKSPVCRAR
jgi:sphinganine-1-phosphate aldolase